MNSKECCFQLNLTDETIATSEIASKANAYMAGEWGKDSRISGDDFMKI